MSATRELVVADIGGTHARFTIAEVGQGRVVALGDPVKLATADYGSLRTAWETFADMAGRELPSAAALAIAAPVRGEQIKLTNNPWMVRPASLGEELGLEEHILINDFEATARGVDAAGEEHFVRVAGPDGRLPEEGVISVIGPGTGLGVAILVRRGGHSHVLATEGGHMDYSPLDAIDDRILARLRRQHTRVSVERVVAGPGLRAIWEVLAEMENRRVPSGDDRQLWTMALEGESSIASAALERFCMAFGAVAGDIALTHGPGAVVLAGGLGARLADRLPGSGFAERFAAKGRYRSLMESVPVKAITHPEPGLFGAAAAFAREYAL